MKKVFLSLIFLAVPAITNAALVPCGKTADGTMCTLCDLVVGIQGLARYIMSIMIIFGILTIVIAGILYIVSAGTPGLMGMAKTALKNALIGTIICLLAFLIVATVMNVLVVKTNMGVQRAANWYTFQCSGQ